MVKPYELWLFIFMILPLGLIFYFFRQLLWHYKRALLSVALLALAIGIPWDIIATRSQIWGWNSTCCLLDRIQGLPLEELFFIIFASLYVSSLTIVFRDSYLNRAGEARRK